MVTWGDDLNKQILVPAFIIALLSVCLMDSAISRQIEVKSLQSVQQELADTKQELQSLQQNYTDQQQQFMQVFTPKIETQLGAKVLWDSKQHENYLWMTGEVYNRGYGMAFNTRLVVKVFTANSTLSSVFVQSLGDIDVYNYKRISHAFYTSGKIERWEITANCSAAK